MVLEKQDSGISLSMDPITSLPEDHCTAQIGGIQGREGGPKYRSGGHNGTQVSGRVPHDHNGHSTENGYVNWHEHEHDDQDQDEENNLKLGEGREHIPLHKSVCCVLCRKKEERIRRHNQELLQQQATTTKQYNGFTSDDQSLHLPIYSSHASNGVGVPSCADGVCCTAEHERNLDVTTSTNGDVEHHENIASSTKRKGSAINGDVTDEIHYKNGSLSSSVTSRSNKMTSDAKSHRFRSDDKTHGFTSDNSAYRTSSSSQRDGHDHVTQRRDISSYCLGGELHRRVGQVTSSSDERYGHSTTSSINEVERQRTGIRTSQNCELRNILENGDHDVAYKHDSRTNDVVSNDIDGSTTTDSTSDPKMLKTADHITRNINPETSQSSHQLIGDEIVSNCADDIDSLSLTSPQETNSATIATCQSTIKNNPQPRFSTSTSKSSTGVTSSSTVSRSSVARSSDVTSDKYSRHLSLKNDVTNTGVKASGTGSGGRGGTNKKGSVGDGKGSPNVNGSISNLSLISTNLNGNSANVSRSTTNINRNGSDINGGIAQDAVRLRSRSNHRRFDGTLSSAADRFSSVEDSLNDAGSETGADYDDDAGSVISASSAPMMRRSFYGGSFRGYGKDPTVELRPIVDPLLRQRLQELSGARNVQLTPKDQKMLARLLARRENEQLMSHHREMSHRQWEEEQQLAAAASSSRRSVCLKPSETPQRHRKDIKDVKSPIGASVKKDSSGSGSPGDPNEQWGSGRWQLDEEGQARSAENRDGDKAESDRRLTIDGSTAHRERHNSDNTGSGGVEAIQPVSKAKLTLGRTKSNPIDRGCDICRHSSPSHDAGRAAEQCACRKFSVATSSSQAEVKQKSMKQLQVALDRKKNVEQRLDEQRQKTEKYLNQLIEKQKHDAARIDSLKSDRKIPFAQKFKLKSFSEKQAKDAEKQLARDDRDSSNHEGTSPSIDSSEGGSSAAEVTKGKATRDVECSKIHADLQGKLEKSRLKQKEIEEELKNWQEQILLYRQMQDKQAEALAQAQIAKKREATQKEREEKERIQRKNKQRMQAQEDEWKATVKAAIISKDQRSRMIQIEREEAIRKSREMANNARLMRDELRQNSSMSDLEQLSKHVLLEQSLRLQSPP